MLPCEQPNNRPPLSREEFARMLPLFLSDYVLVVRHVVRSPHYYSPDLRSMQAFYAAVLADEIPPLHLLNRVVGFVLNQLFWNAKARPLTEDEDVIHAAAQRLSTSMWGPDTH